MLLNILIAQLSDIYNLLRTDAQIEVDINRAWIVAKVELNIWHGLVYKQVGLTLCISYDTRLDR